WLRRRRVFFQGLPEIFWHPAARHAGLTLRRAERQTPGKSAAAALGKALVAAIQEKQQYPDQIKSMELQKQYFRKLITLHKDDWPYEYQFWSNQDWL
ncbi:MAG: hypothetical protein L6437_00370, partial [Kiritimatiellae bacterium]|nr:hypothetical protein [Kiritimatiellia bacterium]